MTTPTQRQLDVLRVIADYIAAHGYSPSIRDIQASLGLRSKNGVHEHLVALQRKGLALMAPATPRSIRLTDAGRTALEER